MILEGRNGSRRVARMKSKSGNGTRGKNERRNDEWKNDEKFRVDRIRVPFELDYVTKISRIELETKGWKGWTLDDVQLGKLNSGVINFLN